MSYVAPDLLDATPYPAAMWQAALDEVERLSAASAATWTAYGTSGTILTAVTANPALGASTWAAAYLLSAGQVHVRFNLTVGAGFTAGTGAYRILLPFAASAAAIAAEVGQAFMDDFGAALRTGSVIAADSTHVEIYRESSTAAIGSAGPGSAWATGDRIKLRYSYEPA
ncbi:hypothetical protein [Dactylosporangium sp. NPDC000521]|uniref:hypothetical protein n=1 Tax=Dactylosporangium sp. NPDC000521 TaxID=3363975 RepID=UPI0036C6DC47